MYISRDVHNVVNVFHIVGYHGIHYGSLLMRAAAGERSDDLFSGKRCGRFFERFLEGSLEGFASGFPQAVIEVSKPLLTVNM